jgi:hypothetical protein
MSVLVSRFINPPKGSQEYNALKKAIEEEPRVVFIGNVDGVNYYQVNSTRELDVTYPVRVWEDKDKDIQEEYEVVAKEDQLVLEKIANLVPEHGQYWIECFCPGATPYFDPSLRDLICWLPKSCYHQAAVLIYVAQQENLQ